MIARPNQVSNQTRGAHQYASALIIALVSFWMTSCSGGDGSESNNNDTNLTLSLPETIKVQTVSKQITFDWAMDEGMRYDLYWSTEPDFDPDDATSNTMEPDITAPFVLSGLSNDQNYYAYLKVSTADKELLSSRLDTRLAAPGVNSGNIGPRGGVNTLVQTNDDRLFIGGIFSQAGHSYGRLQVIDDQLGHQRAHPVIQDTVTAVAADNQGGYFIATDNPEQILRVTSDGEVDPDFSVTTNSEVRAMAVHNNTLYAGGQFSEVNGTNRDSLVALTMDGNVLVWNPDPVGDVFALLVHDDVLYAGGEFSNSTIFNAERSYVAAFDLNNNRTLTNWAPDLKGEVRALAAIDDHILLGGDFTEVNTVERRYLAKIDLNGNLTDFDLGLNRAVDALQAKDGWVYVGGNFDSPQETILRSDASGTLDVNWPDDVPPYDISAILATDHGVYIAGNFDEVGDNPVTNFAKYLPDGSLDTSIGYGVDYQVYDLALVDDRVVIGSEALIRVAAPARGLATLDLDGRWLDFPVTLDGSVQSLRIHQGNLYVGGNFEQVSAPNQIEPVARSGVASFALDSAELQPFAPQLSQSRYTLNVSDILPVGNDFVIAGRFDSVNGTSQRSLVRVNQQGQISGNMAQLDGEFDTIYALTLANDDLYVSGRFDSFDGNNNAQHLARVHLSGPDSGELDTGWMPDISDSNFSSWGIVNDMLILNDLIYLTGAFTQFNGTDSRNDLAAINILNGDLSDWTASLSGPGSSQGYGLLNLPDQDGILVAGTFNEVDGTETGRLALLHRSDASLDITSNLGQAIAELQQSGTAYSADLNQATGNLCIGMSRHEEEDRLRVGVHCMDSMGNLLW